MLVLYRYRPSFTKRELDSLTVTVETADRKLKSAIELLRTELAPEPRRNDMH